MEPLAKRLRERARELGLSDAEVGRRAGLSERRYGNYTRGVREPDLATLVRICAVLDLTPNELLADQTAPAPGHAVWLSRLNAVARHLSEDDLRVAVLQIEALRSGRIARSSSK
jgi:transcriptional regulator with XRE-family HTH domain